ncbi:MAG TPA: TetR/AcrR family transcriptional regulator [Bacilli bacterium]|jgi:AcrR family transcriptional regulator|nr:TetR/AcrR family transcriptional regulator [Bacilli bacterium]NLT01829.1 TetR/AcrR family transcriptional regulator [Acholeplasmataceae bacterium]HNZ77311.1 TetR/AcrR family transcriptional regulator [Bacilli bacterium]HOD60654.1 TetR/AcrR family transcriptional regulator [Bacilli bacterium]HOE06278.1 TetR/AcrR family transcriptional regulator [Bacilli bacterium]
MAKKMKIDMRNEILKSVESLISVSGVNSISLKDIAKTCNISKGTLYYYYKTKDEIIFDVIVKHVQELHTEYLDWIERHQHDLTIERFLSVILYKGVKLFNRAKLHIFLVNECIKGNDVLRNKFNELWNKWHKILQVGIKKAFKNEQESEDIAYLLMLIIDGLAIQEVLQNQIISEERIITLMKKIGERDVK